MQLPESLQGLLSRGENSVRGLYNNAPLLRYINPNNRYNHVSNTDDTDPSRTRTIQGHVIHVSETNDGVFSNMAAKPSTNSATILDSLPTYSEASHDPSPPYWETSVMSEFDEIYIDGIPVGNVFNFLWSALVSFLFQFLGFVITYLLHTSHAAKNGAQVGLGITIINLGLAALPIDITKHELDSTSGRFEPQDASVIDVSLQNDGQNSNLHNSLDGYHSSLQSHGDFSDSSVNFLNGTPILAYFLFILGGFIITKAIYDFYKVKKLEYSIMHPMTSRSVNNDENTSTTNDTETSNSFNGIELSDNIV